MTAFQSGDDLLLVIFNGKLPILQDIYDSLVIDHAKSYVRNVYEKELIIIFIIIARSLIWLLLIMEQKWVGFCNSTVIC